jgi:hypothetical protein
MELAIDCTASRVIDYLKDIMGMTFVEASPTHDGVLDLHTGAIITANPEDPDANTLIIQYPGGAPMAVMTHVLVKHCFMQHARLSVEDEGGNFKLHFEHIQDHFYRKTGWVE